MAVARAIITSPEILPADEPTGALDSKSSAALLDVFEDINTMGPNHSYGDSLNRSSSSCQARALYQGRDSLPDLSWGKDRASDVPEISDTLTVMAGKEDPDV